MCLGLIPALARTFKPRAAAPARRLRTIRRLSDAGILVSVSVAPIIPFVTEPELEKLLEAAHDASLRPTAKLRNSFCLTKPRSKKACVPPGPDAYFKCE